MNNEHRKQDGYRYEYLLTIFGQRMAQARLLTERIIRDDNPVIVEHAREKLAECERHAGELRDSIWELLTRTACPDDIVIEVYERGGHAAALIKQPCIPEVAGNPDRYRVMLDGAVFFADIPGILEAVDYYSRATRQVNHLANQP